MTLPDWSAITAGVLAFLSSIFWLGRQHQRINKHDESLGTVDEAIVALNAKMDDHTKTSAEQWAQVQRALGRLEGHLGTRPDTGD